MRPKAVATVALIAVVALVAVPGSAGSRSPSPPAPIDPALFVPVDGSPRAPETATGHPTPDPLRRSGAALDRGSVLTEPAAPPAGPDRRPAVGQPVRPGVIVVATPRPTPPPTAAPRSAATPRPTATTSSGGAWRYDPEVSWYGPGFYGNRTACGQTLTTGLQGVAHRTLACGTRVSFRNPANGRTVTVPVVDRGPYVDGRQWDLTGATCVTLDHCYTGPLEWRFP